MTPTKQIPRKRTSLRKGPVCSICRHEHRVLIEATRIAGASLDNISAKYGVSRDSIFRHMRAHVPEDLRAELSALYGFPGQAPAAEGMGQFYSGDHNYPDK